MPSGLADIAGGISSVEGLFRKKKPAQPPVTPGQQQDQPPSYHDGGKVGKKGGKVEEGEIVVPKEAAKKMDPGAKEAVMGAIAKGGAKKTGKSKKKIKEVSTRALHGGGYLMTHKHHAPHQGMEHDEEHAAPDEAAMAAHMQQNPPVPSMMEEEGADAGAGAMPGAGAAPPMMGK